MPEVVIEARDLGKKYQIGSLHAGRITAKEFASNLLLEPYRRLRASLGGQLPTDAQREFWALRNVSFQIYEGETFGIIGVNGSGKSTLLRLISSITFPSEGEIATRGRVSSLLEIGSGFNPELTGRDNIYINGIILGMTRPEIDRKFDSILDFAAIHEFIDTPLKRYSTGMMARLAFSVAVHLEPEILIIDEVLAVGDWAFIQKSIDKVRSIARSGATVIIVSHMMSFITDLCDRVMWLEKGQVVRVGSVPEVTADYLETILSDDRAEKHTAEDQLAAQRAKEELIVREQRRQANLWKMFEQGMLLHPGDALLTLDENGVVMFASPFFDKLVPHVSPLNQPISVVDETLAQAVRDLLASASPSEVHLTRAIHNEQYNILIRAIGDQETLEQSETVGVRVRFRPDRKRAEFAPDLAKIVQVHKAELVEESGPTGANALYLQCTYEIRALLSPQLVFGVDIRNLQGVSVFYSNDAYLNDERKHAVGVHVVRLLIPVDLLAPGYYTVRFNFWNDTEGKIEDDPGIALTFQSSPEPAGALPSWPSIVYAPKQWTYVETLAHSDRVDMSQNANNDPRSDESGL